MSFKPIYYSASLSLFKSPKARSDQLLPRHGLAALGGGPFCVQVVSSCPLLCHVLSLQVKGVQGLLVQERKERLQDMEQKVLHAQGSAALLHQEGKGEQSHMTCVETPRGFNN